MATVSLLLLPILYRPACSDIHALQHHSPPKRKSIEVNTNLKKKNKANELFSNSNNYSERAEALQTAIPCWVSGAVSVVSRVFCFPLLLPLWKSECLNRTLLKNISKSIILNQPRENRGSKITITTRSIYVSGRPILLDKYTTWKSLGEEQLL